MTPHVAAGAELHYHLIVLNINSTSDHLSEHFADCAAGRAGPGVRELSLPPFPRAVGCGRQRLFWSELCGSPAGGAGTHRRGASCSWSGGGSSVSQQGVVKWSAGVSRDDQELKGGQRAAAAERTIVKGSRASQLQCDVCVRVRR